MLFNARVHPGTAVTDLGDRERRRLRTQLPRVLEHGTVAQRSTWWCPQDQPEA